MVVFQSTLPARGATYRVADERYSEEISIHAPRTGSDCAGRNGRTEQQDFNPRSPHGERPGPHSTNKNAISFQSTLPARGATQGRRRAREGLQISIHAPRTGSDRFLSVASSTTGAFQSTLPARGATSDRWQMYHNCQAFQSTLPARGATPPKHGSTRIPGISIHAPRTGSDRDWKRGAENPERISIHAPRTGSDDISAIAKDKYNQFQSTLPARGATDAGTKRGTSGQFQSTLPARGATMADVRDGPLYRFQSTLPARGATCAY